MDSKILIILINDGNELRKDCCFKSLKQQSYKEIKTTMITNQLSNRILCDTLSEGDAEYVLFMHTNDSLSVDYCRTLLIKAERGADIVVGEFLEAIGEELFYCNRTFNQNEFNLHGHEIEETYLKLKSLDYSWNTLWNKLYKKELLLKAVKAAGGCNTEKELGIQINEYVFHESVCFASAPNNYYYRRISETKYSEYIKEHKDYFTDRYVKVENPLYFEEIKSAILDPEVKIISFDIFDTLLLRPFLYPTDLFIVLEQYVNSLIKTTDGIGFQKLRISAEMCIREKNSKFTDVQEVTFDQIYDELAEQCSMLKPYIDRIKDREVELELQYCYQRKTGKELYDLAIYAGKYVIYTSDMYLSVDTVEKLLEKNGYNPEHIFVSSQCGKTKATGDLYEYVIEKLDCSLTEVLHIGDNMETDVMHAKDRGLKSFHLPRAEELFNNWNPDIYSGRYFSNMFESKCGTVQNYDAKELLGIRCMMAVCANKLYDYPFVIYDRTSDFNGNPYNIGYFTLGMHIYAVARWLIDQTKENKYDNLHFMARDGYLIKKAYEMLSELFDVKTNVYYTYMSRKALVPLILQSKEDCYNLMNSFNGVNILPKVIFSVIEPVIRNEEEHILSKWCKEIGVAYDKPIGSRENFLKLSDLIATKLFDEQKAKEFKYKFGAHFNSQLSGRTGTFDLGYSARVESVLKENFGCDITANYIHTCLDKAFQRELKSGVKVNCFYDFTPYISGIARELLMSELSGSCIGYDFTDNKAVPKFETFEIDSSTYYPIHFMQSGAMDFIRDMVHIFGLYNKNLLIRNYYASIPFDYYLTFSSSFDRSVFSRTVFEDDMGLGNKINFESFWDKMIYRIPEGIPNKINYSTYGKVRRWMLMLLCGDLGEIKSRVRGKLYRHKMIYGMAKTGYNGLKCVYHKIRH